MQKKLILIVLAVAVIGASVWGYTKYKGGDEAPQIVKGTVTRGSIVETVGATGTLEAVTTVQVGTQVSGTVDALYADFNSIVRKGQVIARLDPSLIQTQIEQQSANVVRAEADLERLRVNLQDARQKLERARQMSERSLIPRTELETAEVNVKSAEAQIRSSQASLTQARAQLNNQRVNLAYTTITAPIDGIVISRNVDQGQTVASSMNAPTLFVIAADLTKMQVLANIDEADVGRMRPGQHVTFRVDAFPNDTFRGEVQQVRLQPAVVQNVVTYSTVIAVPNTELKLKPGMTANVNIEIARRTNALRIPNAALRFRPTTDMFAALNQAVPPEMQRGQGGFPRGNRADGGGAAGAGAQGTATSGQPGAGAAAAATREPRAGSAEARGGGDASSGASAGGGRGRGFDPNMTPEERQRRREEFLKNMTPEQRERFEARMREGGGRGVGGGRDGAPGAGRGGAQAGGGRAATQAQPQSRTMASGATTIDSLFAPLPVVETRGTV